MLSAISTGSEYTVLRFDFNIKLPTSLKIALCTEGAQKKAGEWLLNPAGSEYYAAIGTPKEIASDVKTAEFAVSR